LVIDFFLNSNYPSLVGRGFLGVAGRVLEVLGQVVGEVGEEELLDVFGVVWVGSRGSGG